MSILALNAELQFSCPIHALIRVRYPSYHENGVHFFNSLQQTHFVPTTTARLCHQSACGSALVSPGWRQDTNRLIVSGKTVNTGFDENEAELGVLVLSVTLEMLSNCDSLT
jgi:hypothetical protein